MSKRILNHARRHRKQWSLSQGEVAYLLGLSSQGAIANHERQIRTPVSSTLLGYEMIFGAPARELFPAIARKQEARIVARARALHSRLETTRGTAARRKRELLASLLERTTERA